MVSGIRVVSVVDAIADNLRDGILAGELLKAQLVGELCIFLAPIMVGGPVGATGTTRWLLHDAQAFQSKDIRSTGRDLFIRLHPATRED